MIGRNKLFGFIAAHDTGSYQLFQGHVNSGSPQAPILTAVTALNDLHRIFKIHQSTRRKLCVRSLARLFPGVLLELLLPHFPQVPELDAIASVDNLIADPLYTRAKLTVTADGPHPYKRELFVAVSLPTGAVILTETLEAAGHRSGVAVWPQPEVYTKNALPFGFDEIHCGFEKPFKVLGVSDYFRPVGCAVVRVDKQKLDIGGIAQSCASKLSESHNRIPCLLPGKGERFPVAGFEHLRSDVNGTADHRFREPGQLPAQEEKISIRPYDMLEIYQINFSVFKIVQRLPFRLVAARGSEGLLECLFQLFVAQTQRIVSRGRVKKRQDVFILDSDEILPEKITCA